MQTTTSAGRVAVPAAPAERPPRKPPLLAAAAPVLGAVVMWMVTGSPFALLFAAFGPLGLLASIVDDRFQRRRESKIAQAQYARGLEAAERAIAAEHARERSELRAMAVDPRELEHGRRDPEWWRATPGAVIAVCLGEGEVPSRVELQHPAADAADAADPAFLRLSEVAAVIRDAPVLVDARDGVGIIGRGVAAVALARSVVSQLAFLLSPEHAGVRADDGDCFGWASGLPHPPGGEHPEPAAGRGVASVVEFAFSDPSGGTARIVCAVAEHADLLPRGCRVLVHVDGTGAATVVRNPSGRNPSGRNPSGLRPWFVSEAQARALVVRAAVVAGEYGLVAGLSALPETVAFAELEPATPCAGHLPATIAVTEQGPATIDLVADGQHAVVGGTTGAGKSELLTSWVLGMALSTPPSEVNFLLVDFKGGSSFASVAHLPHAVGLITDLDQSSARRALLSLRAELRHRERVLADCGVKSIDDLRGAHRLPRLVIVVDEYAVVATEFPELQALFTDLAARGRSLGVHLILCTQRPAGTVRDAVLANCSLRLSLRVTNPADSSAVIGSPAAAELPSRPLGRCYLSSAGAQPVRLQLALAVAADIDRACRRWPAVPLRRPWCDPLPAVVTDAELASLADEAGLVFALADVPEEQCRRAALYDPSRDGNLVVFGGHGSGKSTVLAAIRDACQRSGSDHSAIVVPAGTEAAWDTVVAALAQTGRGRRAEGSTLYLIDDVDAIVGGLPDEHRLPFVENLARLLREGPGRGVRTLLTAARSGPGIHSLLALCDSRLLLRMPSRQEHLLCGGAPDEFTAGLAPGGGHWRGQRIQVAQARLRAVEPGAARAQASSREPFGLGELCGDSGPLAVVAADAASVASRIRRRLPPDRGAVAELAGHQGGPGAPAEAAADAVGIVVADPRAWQANWMAMTAHIAGGAALFIDCSVADICSLSGSRELPPPLGPEPGAAVLRRRNGSMRRVQLPSWLLDDADLPAMGDVTSESV